MKAQSVGQFEKNVSVSFGYVKKDLLMVNDSVSELHDKIQHLSLNQAMLLEKIAELEKIVSAKKTDVGSKKKVAKATKKVEKKILKKTKKTEKKTSKTPRKVVTETVLYE
jgi:hypothetical protein